jgi:hypothetical protein
MLTPNDPRPDGHRIQYLEDPEQWRHFDPVVFDHLHKCVIEQKNRAVRNLKSRGILPNCKFYSEIIQDGTDQRKKYLQIFLKFAHNSDLIFFDPDNGMEVKSVCLGRRRSSKYLYFSEVQQTFSAGHSILIYQHLTPRPRRSLVSGLASRFQVVTGVNKVYLYWTQFVVFLLISQPRHENYFVRSNKKVAQLWKDQIHTETFGV